MIAFLPDLATAIPHIQAHVHTVGVHAVPDFGLHSVWDSLQLPHLHQPWDLAQFKQTDLGSDIGKAFDKFVKTGQAWAFLIGLIAGYVVRSFTSFG